MIYKITELSITISGNKSKNSFLFENLDCALRSLKVVADNRLKQYEDGWLKESWLDLEAMKPTYHDLDGELMIDGTEEPIAFQYIDPDTFTEIGKNYQRKGF